MTGKIRLPIRIIYLCDQKMASLLRSHFFFIICRMLRILVFISFVSIVFFSCKENPPTYGDVLANGFEQKSYKEFDTTAYLKVFHEVYGKQKSKLHNPSWMKELSDSTEGMTLIAGHLFDGSIDTLLNYFEQSEKHGIRSSYFHTTEIKETLFSLRKLKPKDVAESYPLLAKLDLLGTDGLVAYVSSIKYGVINPKRLYGRYFVPQKRMNYAGVVHLLDSVEIGPLMAGIQPKNQYYIQFQDLLENGNLDNAQRTKVLMVLEKLRWMGESFPEKYVIVNIPEQRLHIMEDGKTSQLMNVCVGETDNPAYTRKGENHETPVMQGILDAMQVNPVWNIPSSIVKKELLASVRNNPNYLASRNMVAYYKGKQVDPSTVNWQSDSVEKFRFKQNPGSDNSLGNVKFLFENAYSIYLHDTPAKQMFGQTNRAVSHGCVRVEKPVDLAGYLVNNEKQAEKIAKEITTDSITKSRWVTLKRQMPVYLTYYTTWLDDDGKMVSYPDIYGYDPRLKEAMKKYWTN
ncbi:L,D-transpeptidase-like protein [Sphingobacterium detergens]|uniref:L,D-transpeptidase-like protein n=2 Tax=Sphingobacterium detergens TaxID=1145106 RepID=A0A420BEQ2_SPHD1|nr:L,D-transpeptidase-like protein [Sphingobacterium detergens]